ncbi:hypothetical protein DFH94DRAFT_494043 [Russula ochroleuca]|jgi:hypothetical protein|uniref:Uncharacterized protein n=1 Tax=Russula ochroleuca TaxID=152965 RepID=A0A9P5T998_9AGAM|nr:hypothetical protein DFH94DRAFT_494043 [Russula ochroleuca]
MVRAYLLSSASASLHSPFALGVRTPSVITHFSFQRLDSGNHQRLADTQKLERLETFVQLFETLPQGRIVVTWKATETYETCGSESAVLYPQMNKFPGFWFLSSVVAYAPSTFVLAGMPELVPSIEACLNTFHRLSVGVYVELRSEYMSMGMYRPIFRRSAYVTFVRSFFEEQHCSSL